MEKYFNLKESLKMNKHSIILIVSLIFVFFIIVVLFNLYFLIHQKANNLDTDNVVTIEIPKGANFKEIVQTLDENNLIKDRWKFILTAKLLRKTRNIQAGKFKIKGGINYVSLVYHLANAAILQKRITIPEGLELTEIAKIFEEKLEIPADSFLLNIDNTAKFDIYYKSVKSIEGFLFPDTYYFSEDARAEDVIQKMVNNFKKNISVDLIWDAEEKGMTVNELITLASIIQGEVIYDSEMPKVASVYYNRLNKNMRLQADPTIQYIIPGPDRLLKISELRTDSEYNTYMHRGLPPGPINNPGLNAILAVIHPDTTDFTYFVATGDGHHTFSKTLVEHNHAKNKLKQFRKAIKDSLKNLKSEQVKNDTITSR